MIRKINHIYKNTLGKHILYLEHIYNTNIYIIDLVKCGTPAEELTCHLWSGSNNNPSVSTMLFADLNKLYSELIGYESI